MLKPRFRLERLGKDAALSAIGGPIQSTHRSYYENSVEELNIEIESLVDELLKIRVETPTGKHGEIVGEFVEPIQLQVVCQRWWRERYKGRHQGKTPSQVILSVQKKSKELIDVDSALKDFYVEAVREASKEAEIYEGVANYNDNTMSVIDGKTNAVISTVNVGNGPGSVAVNPKTNMVYVANAGSNMTSVIDGSTNDLITIIGGHNSFAVAERFGIPTLH